jgi:hypothetical protein
MNNYQSTYALCLAVVVWMNCGLAQADTASSPVDACLAAWGKHPFGSNPQYRTLATAVKVFGRGPDTADRDATSAPSLVLINPGVNVMGGSKIELLNPNGWYCMRTAVNVMGGTDIKLSCQAKLASTSSGGGATVLGSENAVGGVTVMGSINVERVGCPAN